MSKCFSIITSLLLTLLLSCVSSAASDELNDEILKFVKETSSHEYDPPSDGKITQNQVDEFIRITERAWSLEARYAGHTNTNLLATIEAIAEEDGNWAEYQWVHSQLKQAVFTRTMANPQRDAASRHNEELLMANEDRLQVILELAADR